MNTRFVAIGIAMIASPWLARPALARGFGGFSAAAAAYSFSDDYATQSNLFYEGGTSGQQTGAPYGQQAPIGVYGAYQPGGTAASPIGPYTGYPAGVAAAGRPGLNYYVGGPSTTGFGGGGPTEYTRTIAPDGTVTSWTTRGAAVYPQGGGVGGTGASLPTDGGLAPAPASPIAGNHSTRYTYTADASLRAASVRTGFVHNNAFTPAWLAAHEQAWRPAAWEPATATAWSPTAWPAVATWCGISTPPEFLDYGKTIVIADGKVFVNGTEFATADQFGTQAIAIADRGRTAQPAANAAWQPLGVFAVVQGDDRSATQAFQLAINRDGVLRGNMYEPTMDSLTGIYGQADKQTQRAAWSVGESKSVVFETGLFNLTKEHTPVLVHFGKDRTQQWTLVRLKKAQAE